MYQMWAAVFRFHVIINREGLTVCSGKSIAFVGNQVPLSAQEYKWTSSTVPRLENSFHDWKRHKRLQYKTA